MPTAAACWWCWATMGIEWNFENLLWKTSMIRVGIGIVFGLFILLFIAVFIEEVFLGGRKRRQAERQARLRQNPEE